MRPDTTGQRVALFGNFGVGNLGNEATLQAMVYNLRRHLPNAEISCICPGPENTTSQYNISSVPIRAPFPGLRLPTGGLSGARAERYQWIKAVASLKVLRLFAFPFVDAYRWFKAFANLKSTNLLIMTGTGMLADSALHYDIFRWAVIARLRRCRLVFVSVGGGPIRHPLNRCFVRAALALADYRSYRDASSKNHLKAIGLDVMKDAVYPDLAFSLPRAVMSIEAPVREGTAVGVGLMNYHSPLGHSGSDETIYRDYLGRLSSLVVRLLDRRYTVRVLIGDFVWDQGVRRDLRRELEERGCDYEHGKIIDEPTPSVDELVSQLVSVDVVVSSRFHNVLLGLMLGRPAIAVSYHEKFKPLMSGMGLEEFCCDIEHIDVDELIKKIVKLIEDAPRIRAQIGLKTENYRMALEEQYVRLFQVSTAVGDKKAIAPSLAALPSILHDYVP